MNADYLVATTEDKALARAMVEWQRSTAARQIGRTLLGAVGVYCPDVAAFVGTWELTGRTMLSVSGMMADGALRMLAEQKPSSDQVSVARLDVQWTLLVTDADEVCRRVQARRRYTQRLIDPAPRRGVTRYVGSRSSSKMLRVYNKSVESGIVDALGEYVRWELELKNEVADIALQTMIADGREGLEAYAQSLIDGMVVDVPRLTTMETFTLIEGNRIGEGHSRWLSSTVLPSLRKLAVRDYAAYKSFLAQVVDIGDTMGLDGGDS